MRLTIEVVSGREAASYYTTTRPLRNGLPTVCDSVGPDKALEVSTHLDWFTVYLIRSAHIRTYW